MEEGRQKALDTAISSIEKKFGKGSVMKLSENIAMEVEAIIYITVYI